MLVDSFRSYFFSICCRLNAWLSLKSTRANDWIVSNNKFSWRWSVIKQCVLGFVGISAKIWSTVLNTAEVHNVKQLIQLLDKRPKGTPLITVSNHDSCCDDPLTFGASLPLKYFFSGFNKCRWTLGAKEICFSQPWHSIMFRLGQVLPIVRGAGVYQPVMDQILEELNRGCWLHIYPEGKVNMDKSFLRLKWGVGRLIADAAVTPIVLPFYHHGLDTILANYPPYVPQTKKRITVVWGEPLYLDAFLSQLRAQKKSAEEIRQAITDRIQEAFYELKRKSLDIHEKHLAKTK